MCLIYAFCGVLFGICSLTTLTVLSTVCCLKVCYPLYGNRFNPDHGRLMIACTWAYALVFACSPLAHWGEYGPEPYGTACCIDWTSANTQAAARSYTAVLFLFCYVLPCGVILSSYAQILVTVRGSRRAVERHVSAQTHTSGVQTIIVKRGRVHRLLRGVEPVRAGVHVGLLRPHREHSAAGLRRARRLRQVLHPLQPHRLPAAQAQLQAHGAQGRRDPAGGVFGPLPAPRRAADAGPQDPRGGGPRAPEEEERVQLGVGAPGAPVLQLRRREVRRRLPVFQELPRRLPAGRERRAALPPGRRLRRAGTAPESPPSRREEGREGRRPREEELRDRRPGDSPGDGADACKKLNVPDVNVLCALSLFKLLTLQQNEQTKKRLPQYFKCELTLGMLLQSGLVLISAIERMDMCGLHSGQVRQRTCLS
ncbi:opsin 7, group member a isoform X3 [Anguilla rostrata]